MYDARYATAINGSGTLLIAEGIEVVVGQNTEPKSVRYPNARDNIMKNRPKFYIIIL